jgi:FixJ family two-component response regulator
MIRGFRRNSGQPNEPRLGWISEISLLTRRKVIAIVDDDSSTLNAIGLLLDAHGFEARTFDSAEAFLERDAAEQVDCLLLDIHLGGLSGIALRLRLVASGSTLPVIFMTGLDDAATRGQALKAGCVAYLQKPVLARQLMDAIHKAMQ